MKIISIFFLALSFSSHLKAQEKLTKDQREVQQTVMNIFDALSNRDSVVLKANCTADILIFEDGMVWNLDTLVRIVLTLKKLDDYNRVNKIEFIHTEVHKDVAWTTYHNQAEITANGKLRSVKWVETVILIRKEKKWKIKILHSTPEKGK